MTNSVADSCVTTVPSGVDGAVGVSQAKWFVAIVSSRHEKAVAEKLRQQGYETFVATQPEMRVWHNGRRKLVDRVVIPSVVFLKCSEKQRRQIVTLPYINRFMVNRSADSGALNKPVAVIPDDQIQRLRFMLGQTDIPVNFEPGIFHLHDNVRVIRGHLRGLEGRILRNPDGSQTLFVSLSLLGGATLRIPPSDLAKLP